MNRAFHSCLALLLLTAVAFAAEPVKKPYGIQKRELWTTGNLHGSPEPPDPYGIEDAFPKLKLHEPLAVEVVPGQNRFGVATRPGKLYTFEIKPDVAEAKLLLDIGRTTYGIAFHPNFAENGYFYVTSILDSAKSEPTGSRISRFQVNKDDPLTADANSERVILEWPSGGHNGGCIRFGPDGYLYLATGDGSGIADELQTGQKIDDLLGAILRIDVDNREGNLPSIPTRSVSEGATQARNASERPAYAIPKDNPFVGRKDARPEIWSFGHRQVWKFSFDRLPLPLGEGRGEGEGDPKQPSPEGIGMASRLYAGEVGQDLWEMVYLIRRGGNYGWSVNEGLHAFRPERPRGPGDIEKPLVEHPHSDFRSITGGYVYHSDRLPELQGAYVYADYDTGRLWMLRYEGDNDGRSGKVTEHRQLADTQIRPVEFAQDDAGEVYLVDFAGGGFHKIVPALPEERSAKPFPTKLSETGLFASTKDHIPAKGLIPYSVNAPLWSDGAEKDRFIALPGDSQIEFDDVVYPHGPDYPDPGWRFPDGTVLVKTFSVYLPLPAGEGRGQGALSPLSPRGRGAGGEGAGDPKQPSPGSLRSPPSPEGRGFKKRLETRILQYRKMPGNDDEYGAQYWFGYTYVWNDEQTDAELLGPAGLDREIEVADPTAEGGKRLQKYHFPSRAECTLCHTMGAKYALGVTTLQMNRDHDYGGTTANQLATLEHIGVFKDKLPKRPEELPRLADLNAAGATAGLSSSADSQRDRHLAARAYLHANCAHCHRKWGGGNADFDLQASIPLTQSKTVNAVAGQGKFNLQDPAILVPGSPERSLILHRMQLAGLGRMPHVASSVVDRNAVELIRAWLADLKDESLLDQPGAINARTGQSR